MSILVDIVLILLFLLIVFFFTKFGLDRALLRIGRKWLSLAVALVIGPYITTILENWFITEGITNAVHASLTGLIEHNANGYNIKEVFDNLPVGFVNFLDGLGASLEALEAEFGSYTEANDEIIAAMAQRIAQPCINIISSIIGMIVGFIIPWAFMLWLDYEIQKDTLTFFRVMDHIVGFIVGVAVAYVFLLGICLLMRTIFQIVIAFDSASPVMDIYNKSIFFKFISEFDTIGTLKDIFHSAGALLS